MSMEMADLYPRDAAALSRKVGSDCEARPVLWIVGDRRPARVAGIYKNGALICGVRMRRDGRMQWIDSTTSLREIANG